MDFWDWVGNLGVICFLVAYFFLQKGSLAPTGIKYLGLNLLGALLVLASLLVHWNLPAFLLEAAWAMLSIAGIIKHITRR